MTRKSSPRGKAAIPEAAHVTAQRSSPIARAPPAESLERLRRREQLAQELYRTGHALTIEHLSSWLIHELSQPLMATVATAQTLRRLLGQRRPDLQEIGQSIEELIAYQRRAGKILQRLRAVLPESEPKRARLDVRELILEVIRFLTDRGDLQGTRVRVSFPRNPTSVRGARVELRQVFLNLILSAVEAMRTRPARQRKLWITAALESEPAIIHIVVCDTGKQARKPDSIQFFGALARAHSHATALGLAVAEAIVAEHGGRIWIRRGRRGVELHVALPAAFDGPA
jgi:two-component system sensor kinase FixL